MGGDYGVRYENQITDINASVSNNNSIILSFILAPNTWYDSNGNLGATTKVINTTINFSFTLAANTWYEEDGNLGTQNKEFSSTIIGFVKRNSTKIKDSINVSEFDAQTGLSNKTAEEGIRYFINAINLINSLPKILTGDYASNISTNNVSNIKATISSSSSTSIELSFDLAKDFWYDEKGNKGTTTKTFKTTIIGFKS